jgi:hypothetical protein
MWYALAGISLTLFLGLGAWWQSVSDYRPAWLVWALGFGALVSLAFTLFAVFMGWKKESGVAVSNAVTYTAFSAIFVVAIVFGAFLYGRRNDAPKQDAPPAFGPITTRIVDQHFKSDRIVVDGKSFFRCTFENITFIYNGTANYEFMDVKLLGEIGLVSEAKPIDAYARLWQSLNVHQKYFASDMDLKTGAMNPETTFPNRTTQPNEKETGKDQKR